MAQWDQFSPAGISSSNNSSNSARGGLRGKLCVVADASTTVGSGIVAELLKDGATVAAALRAEEQIEKLMEDCAGVPTEALFPKVVDFGDEVAFAAYLEELVAKQGRPIDHVVSVHGQFWEGGPLTEQPTAELRRVLSDIPGAHFVVAKCALPLLKPAHASSFLFMSEGAGKLPLSVDTSLYTVAASCTYGIVLAAQTEFADAPFRVNEMRLYSLFKRHSDVGNNYTNFYGKKAFSARKAGKLAVEALQASKHAERIVITSERLDGNALTV